MSISREEVLRMARLAQLDLSEAEVEGMTRDLSAVLDYVAVLQSVEVGDDVSAQEPEAMPLREDQVVPGLARGEAVAGAPEASGDLFKVPPAIGGDAS